MMDAIGKDSYNGVNVFEGVEPVKESNSRSPLAIFHPVIRVLTFQDYLLVIGGN